MRWDDLFHVDWRALNPTNGVRAALLIFVPLLAAQSLGQPVVGLMVGIGALFATLSDTGPSYATRLRATIVTAIGVGLFATLGQLTGGQIWITVPVIFAAALLGGMAAVYGDTAVMVGRVLTIAVDFGFGLALYSLPPYVGASILVGGLLTAITVAVLALMAASWRSPGSPVPTDQPLGLGRLAGQLTLRSTLLRYSTVRAVAIAAAAGIAWGVGLPRPFWTPLPVIVTLRPRRREAFLLIVQYLIGSAVAVGLTVGIIVAVSGTLPREGIAVVFAFAAFSLRKTNYALFVAMLITMILLLITLLVGGDLSLPELRILETLLGLSIASIVAFVWDDRGGEPL